MRQDLGAQQIDVAHRRAEPCHMLLIAGDETGQEIGERRPSTVDIAPLGPRVERFSVLVIGIYQTGENHSAEQGKLEGEAGLVHRLPTERRHQPAGLDADLALPDGIERSRRKPLQPFRQRGKPHAGHVRQAGVMPGNGIGNERGDAPIVAAGASARDERAGGRMVDPLLAAV